MKEKKNSKTEKRFPWDIIIYFVISISSSYYSVAFSHKTFQVGSLDVPLTPLLLFFASIFILGLMDLTNPQKSYTLGEVLFLNLIATSLVFGPTALAWHILNFYEVSTLPSFLFGSLIPIVVLVYELRDWSKKKERSVRSLTSKSQTRIPRIIWLIGLYVSAIFFGYFSIIFVCLIYTFLFNQSFDNFARTNPHIILLGGATLVAGILALSRPKD